MSLPPTDCIDERRKLYAVLPTSERSCADTSVANDVQGVPVQRAVLCPTHRLTVDQYVQLLSFIEDGGGISTLYDISRVLHAVAEPVGAVFDLCDEGILSADLDAPLDGNTRIWRVGR